MYLNPRFACSNQNELWNHYEGIDNKTQLFFKIISMLSRLFGGSLKTESPSMPSIVVHLLPRMKVRDLHRHQSHDTKLQG